MTGACDWLYVGNRRPGLSGARTSSMNLARFRYCTLPVARYMRARPISVIWCPGQMARLPGPNVWTSKSAARTATSRKFFLPVAR